MPSPLIARADALMNRKRQFASDGEADIPVLTDAVDDDDIPLLIDVAPTPASPPPASIAPEEPQHRRWTTFPPDAHDVVDLTVDGGSAFAAEAHPLPATALEDLHVEPRELPPATGNDWDEPADDLVALSQGIEVVELDEVETTTGGADNAPTPDPLDALSRELCQRVERHLHAALPGIIQAALDELLAEHREATTPPAADA